MRCSLAHGAPLFLMNLPSLSSRLQFFYCSSLNDPPKHWQPSARLHAVTSHIHWHKNINLILQQKFLYHYAKHTKITHLFNVRHHASTTDQCVKMSCKHVMHSSQDRILQILILAIFILNCYLKQQNRGTHTSLQYLAQLWNLQSTHYFYSCWTCHVTAAERIGKGKKNTHSSTLADICARMCKTEGSITHSNVWYNVT